MMLSRMDTLKSNSTKSNFGSKNLIGISLDGILANK